MRKEGAEFGATTGRPRRCGWLDLPALKYATMINGVTQLLMMKADVLNIFEEIKVCTSYNIDGDLTDHFPFDSSDENIDPVYETVAGWHTSLVGLKDFDSLPSDLRSYRDYIEKNTGVPISLISTGPDRTETISL
jgi:adenylosuccinate synthase